MRKTATQVESEVRRLTLTLPRGLAIAWVRMLAYIEEYCDGRPGFLWQDAAALPAEQLSSVLGCTPDKVSALLDRMLRKSPGLLRRDEAGTLYSPHLTRIAKIRGGQKRRADRFRSRHGPKEALRNASEGVTSHRSNATITPPSPPDGFSLSHSLSSLPPPPRVNTASVGEMRADPESQARCWLSANRPDLLRKFHSFADLIRACGGDRNRALAEAEPYLRDRDFRDPFAYAIRVVEGNNAKRNGANVRPAIPLSSQPKSRKHAS
jgi:hypothetical protein